MDQPSTTARGGSASVTPFAASILAAALSMTGCQGMATTPRDAQSADRPAADNTVADWPLTFVQHNFGARCFATFECTVTYDGLERSLGDAASLRPALEDVHPDALRNASAGQVGIMNFPGPARVRWRSRDGGALEAEVDIDAIFEDQRILHEVPREDVAEGVSILNPDILLVVQDRTINVFMRARIPTRTLRTPGNPHSDFRKDLVLAWSRTYD